MTSPEKPPKTRRRASAFANALAFTVRDAQAMGAPSRTTIYGLIKDGILKTVDAPGCRCSSPAIHFALCSAARRRYLANAPTRNPRI